MELRGHYVRQLFRRESDFGVTGVSYDFAELLKRGAAAMNSGERARPACWRWRPRQRELGVHFLKSVADSEIFSQKVRCGEGAATSTRGRMRSPEFETCMNGKTAQLYGITAQSNSLAQILR